jgi:chemotaxis response regulator CheB
VIRVVIADDQALVRAGLRSLIEQEDDLAVTGEAPDGAAAIDLVRRERPDVVLMDIRMPVLDGLEATRRLTRDRELDGVRVLVLTTFELDEYIFEALRAGRGRVRGQGRRARPSSCRPSASSPRATPCCPRASPAASWRRSPPSRRPPRRTLRGSRS